MWRLKIGEGSNDPYLFSTNNFTGRQTWVFDPEAGTPEERAEVEEARQNFYKNRHQVKASSDLLWRMQFLREKNFKQTIPPVKIEDGEEITYEKATTTLRRAISFFAALQSSDGHWPAENGGPMFFLPPFVICFYITGHLNIVFPIEYQKEILRYLYNHQNEDGGWGLHIEGHSIMFCTALSYICMRILGEGPDGGKDNACARARKWILDHGSVTHIPSWGKSWLSEDLYYPHPWIQDMLWDSLYILTEPLLTRWPFNKLVREKALQVTMKHIHYEDEISRYLTIGVVEKVICMLACWVEDPNGDYFKKHLARVKEFIWIAEDGIKMHSFGSQLWDTSFTIQALLASDLINEIGPVRDNPSGDFKRMYRHISKGSWTFSDQDHGLQVSDCTAHSLKCCLLFSTMPSEVVGENLELDRLFDSVNILLSLQSKNGGLPAWEPARAGDWLDLLNPIEFLEDIVVEHEYVECTASTIQALILFKKLHPRHRMEEIDSSIRNGISYIENTQLPDGSWVHALDDLAEYDVFFVESLGLGGADEELRSVGSETSIGHGEDFGASVLLHKVLVGELGVVDRLASCAVSGGEVTSLAHEPRDHVVKR
nr:beta-amyrin synthase 1 [Quercus suber]